MAWNGMECPIVHSTRCAANKLQDLRTSPGKPSDSTLARRSATNGCEIVREWDYTIDIMCLNLFKSCMCCNLLHLIALVLH